MLSPTLSQALSPLLSIQVYHDPPVYRPGEVMRFDYQIDAVDERELSAVEASVLWQTEGKGDQDIGVHFFERRVPGDFDEDVRALRTSYVVLPQSPLSYHGEILQVRWLIRLRVFVKGSKEYVIERPFVLSTTETPTRAQLVPHES